MRSESIRSGPLVVLTSRLVLAGVHDTPLSHHSTPALFSSAFLPPTPLPLVTAVHSGDVVRFNDVLKVSQAKFQQDKTYTLIIRLVGQGRGRAGEERDRGGGGWGIGEGQV